MECDQCHSIETQFDYKVVARKVRLYHLNGLKKESKILIDALTDLGVEGHTLLDVGGGFGVLEFELLKAGVSIATNVETSSAYIDAAKNEIVRQVLLDQITIIHGDFVSVKHKVSPADIVTLDKVICCYEDVVSLVETSVEKANKLYGLIYPRNTWWVRAGVSIKNFIRKLKGNNFRMFVHPTLEVDRIIRENGLKMVFKKELIKWQIVVYAR